jgi:ParB-like chromosome segregation protein Spo0J
MSDSIYPTRLIADITINKRHRRDAGDVAALAASINEIGLLHPVVIRPDGALIAGARRIAACQELGWTEVPVTVVDLADVVKGEYAENAYRKNFLPTEIDAIYKAMAVEKAAARERMTLGKLSTGSAAGKTRDKIGEFAGVSGKTVEKIAAVVDAAHKHPRKYAGLVEQMDKTGKVDRAYREVRRPTHDALGRPWEPAERKKSLHGFARLKQVVREERERLVVEQREDPDQVPTLRELLAEIEEQAGEPLAVATARVDQNDDRRERPLDDITDPSSIIPVFEEDVPEDDRSSGRPEDDERREYEQELHDRWGD